VPSKTLFKNKYNQSLHNSTFIDGYCEHDGWNSKSLAHISMIVYSTKITRILEVQKYGNWCPTLIPFEIWNLFKGSHELDCMLYKIIQRSVRSHTIQTSLLLEFIACNTLAIG